MVLANNKNLKKKLQMEERISFSKDYNLKSQRHSSMAAGKMTLDVGLRDGMRLLSSRREQRDGSWAS